MRRSLIVVATLVVGVAVGAVGMLLLVQVGGPQDSTAESRATGSDGSVARVTLSTVAPDVPDGEVRTGVGVDSGVGVSPSVYANSFTLGDPIAPQDFLGEPPDGFGPEEVTLVALVLWRGAPGWFLRSAGDVSGFQTSIPSADGVWETVARVGPPGHVFDLAWNPETRVLRVQGVEVALADDNVILVDGVGSAEGMRIVGTRRVANPRFTMGDYAALLRQSEELRDYLRCDLPLPADAKPPEKRRRLDELTSALQPTEHIDHRK